MPKKKTTDTQEPNVRRILTDWIQDYYVSQGWDKNDINWKMITAQLKNMESEYNINDKGIKYTLWYMSEIRNVNLVAGSVDDEYNGSILNLVPFYIQDAQRFYQQTVDIKEQVKEFEFPQDEIVKIKTTTKASRPKKNIDFD